MKQTTSPSKQMKDINPAWEAEIKKVLDEIWENRYRLSLENLKMLRRLANKTKL
jgi:regulator of replication initiation timing